MGKIQSFQEEILPNTKLSSDQLKQMDQILDQPFYFIGSGVQCYAFISQDQKVILKFFKHHHLGPSTRWLQKFPVPFKAKIIANREKRMRQLFKSSQIAYDSLREETGLFYLHISPTKGRHHSISIFDKIGVRHQVNLDETPFVLQKRARLFPETLNALFSKQDLCGAKEALRSLMKLTSTYVDKGVKSKDCKIDKNFGFIDKQALQIDIGSFVRRSNVKKLELKKIELEKMAKRLTRWIEKYFPQCLDECRLELQRVVNENSL